MVLARQGYDLMDKKRNILMRELMSLTDQAKEIQTQIDQTYKAAYLDLQAANVELGISNVQMIAASIPVEDSIKIHTRSIMGTEIPLVCYEKETDSKPPYAFYRTRDALDRARGEGNDDPPVAGRNFRIPSRCRHSENAEACERSAEYHDPALRGAGEDDFKCT